jgi:putative chitinase
VTKAGTDQEIDARFLQEQAMLRSVEILQKVAPKAFPNYVRAFENGEDLLRNAGISSPIRISHFLAQMMQETGGGTVLRENLRYTTPQRILDIFGVGHHSAAIRPEELPGLVGNPEALAERVYGLGNPLKADELGNTRPGDGYLFRGGGVLQTTGGANYKHMGDRVGADFYGTPDLIVDPRYALQPALFEWSDKDLNAAADRNDIRTITRAINGGYIGLAGRQHWFDTIWPVASGSATPPPAWQAAAADDSTRWLQESLNHLGVQPQLLVDGRYGPATTAAVKWFQGIAGIPVDGVAGAVTLAAVRLRIETT